MAGATLFERAQSISTINPEEGITLLNKIVRELEVADNDEELIRIKEQRILQLGELYKREGKAKELADLIKVTRPFLQQISKAKAAKLVRTLVDYFLDIGGGTGIEVQLCKDCIEWAKQEKRTFLRQSLEARLIALFFDTKMYTEALQLESQLLKELKKLDDKNLLVEVQLLESKTYHALSNLSKVSFFFLIFLLCHESFSSFSFHPFFLSSKTRKSINFQVNSCIITNSAISLCSNLKNIVTSQRPVFLHRFTIFRQGQH